MFENILSQIGVSLGKHNLPYMVVGGQAVLLYGEPRLTRDVGITLGMDVDRLGEVLSVAQELNVKLLPKEIESFIRETMVLPALDEHTGIRVDFIFSYTPYETGAINRSKKVKIMGQEVNFASSEDLIIHKIFAGRPRDIEDLRTILLKNPDVDKQYIREWLKEFDEASEEKNFLKIFQRVAKDL